MDTLFNSIITNSDITFSAFSSCLACSIILGLVISIIYSFKNKPSKSFIVTLAILPAIVQMVIMLVNGSVGAGIAVAGAFSLVRFRSAPGNAKEIACVFLAMSVGLATGMGYLAYAFLFVVIIGLMIVLFGVFGYGDDKGMTKELRITIPEGLEFEGVFDEVFDKYLTKSELVEVKTSNMGSLYKLKYN
ncbi:MAG: DUF4956 domain-containing protein, partial [Clostridia bacterium]|nr:DUF4956 domain-containing protein [Clostridia bacterium]